MTGAYQTINIRYRNHRRSVNHPAFNRRSPQVEPTGLTVSNSGAAIAIRPPRTAIRRMDTKGTGTVGYW